MTSRQISVTEDTTLLRVEIQLSPTDPEVVENIVHYKSIKYTEVGTGTLIAEKKTREVLPATEKQNLETAYKDRTSVKA